MRVGRRSTSRAASFLKDDAMLEPALDGGRIARRSWYTGSAGALALDTMVLRGLVPPSSERSTDDMSSCQVPDVAAGDRGIASWGEPGGGGGEPGGAGGGSSSTPGGSRSRVWCMLRSSCSRLRISRTPRRYAALERLCKSCSWRPSRISPHRLPHSRPEQRRQSTSAAPDFETLGDTVAFGCHESATGAARPEGALAPGSGSRARRATMRRARSG